jgi:hypothetical protein
MILASHLEKVEVSRIHGFVDKNCAHAQDVMFFYNK